MEPFAGHETLLTPEQQSFLGPHTDEIDTPALISRPTTTSTITPISAFVPIFPTSLAISSPRKYETPT